MNYWWIEKLSYVVGIAALIGLIRIRKIDRAYYPFIAVLVIALTNEIINTIAIKVWGTNAVNDNIYSLLESVLLLFFFRGLGLFERRKWMFWLFLGVFLAGWIVVCLIIWSLFTFPGYYNAFYSFVIVLMAITMINRVMNESRKGLVANPVFIIMIGFIVFFTYKAMIEIFWLYGVIESGTFQTQVYRIMTYINLAANILYTIAVLWIPKKRDSTLL